MRSIAGGRGWVLVLLLGAMVLAASGCAAPANALNYATAHAISYSGLKSDARRKSPELEHALKLITESEEHRHMQAVLANLPADMTRCLVIEIADIDGKGAAPSLIALFETETSIGFLSNFSFDEDGNATEVGGGWQAAVWDAPDDVNDLFPKDPAALLSCVDPSTRPGVRTVIIVTMAVPGKVLVVGGWADEESNASKAHRLIGLLPEKLRSRVRLARSL